MNILLPGILLLSIYFFTNVSGLARKCNCSCTGMSTDLATLDPALNAKTEEMASSIKVDTKNTSAHARALTSAKDDRTSAQATGALGIVLLCTVFGMMIAIDATRLCGSRASVSEQ